MTNLFKRERSTDHVESQDEGCFLERIPEDVYTELTRIFSRRFLFVNGPEKGGRLHLAEYFLGIRRSTANELLGFVQQVLLGAQARCFPAPFLPEGFVPPTANLVPHEQQGGMTFGYFDAAITTEGLQVIEVQAFPTYHVTAAFSSHFLQDHLPLCGSSVYANAPEADWQVFVDFVQTVLAGEAADGIVLADRNLASQRTSFDFHATQRELDLNLDLVDTRFIYEEDGRLFYRTSEDDRTARQLRRLYNRALVLEAIEEDQYPRNPSQWRFRYDRTYADFAIVNHPAKSLEISKHILPYISHPINPPCHELAELAAAFRSREIGYGDFVWKHKWGAAGRGLFLLPNAEILDDLTKANALGDYIAQHKVEYERFRTGDGKEKIVELRLMTVQSTESLLVVPMARIGHVQTTDDGRSVHHIHFGENNRTGYGFCPTLIFDP